MKEKEISRRQFLTRTAKIGVAGAVAPTLLASCTNSKKLVPLREEGSYYIPELPDRAIDGRPLKVGVIGCGGRANGALCNLWTAAPNVTLWSVGDALDYKADEFIANLEWTKNEADCKVDVEGRVFYGFDAYKSVIDSGVDMVIIATPPVFRPTHFAYATEKGVHSFLEKPVAVDAKGYRLMMATAKQAEAKGLAVVTGTQRHHQRPYVEAFKRIQQGYIGEITGGNVYWNQGMLWYKEREKGWSDMEWMIRDWVNWKWLSGDHIVEQHVHNIDVFLWMSGLKPVKATAFGARHRRITGDQYDQFSVDFEFENGIHLHSMCRQIDGCSTRIGEFIQGTKGSWDSEEECIKDLKGNVIWKYENEPGVEQYDPYTLEHVDWVNHIRKGTCHVEAAETAISTLAGIMGREAAYTGQTVTWDEISSSAMDYMPEKLELGKMDMSKYVVEVPGSKQ